MFTVAVFGAGKIGEAICGLLTMSGRYKVKVCDSDFERAKKVATAWKGAESHTLNLNNEHSVADLLKGTNAVISALPFHCNTIVAKVAAGLGVNYFDLTEDVETTRAVTEFSKNSTDSYIYNHYCFWFSVGILIYLGGSFFFYILIDHLDKKQVKAFGNLTYFAEIIKNILFALAIFIYAKFSFKFKDQKTSSVPYLDMI